MKIYTNLCWFIVQCPCSYYNISHHKLFKGTVSRDFWVLLFFHQIAPPGPFRGTQGRFWFLPNIQGDIRIWNCFRGVTILRCILHREVTVRRCILQRKVTILQLILHRGVAIQIYMYKLAFQIFNRCHHGTSRV